jgi:hypothetical protein
MSRILLAKSKRIFSIIAFLALMFSFVTFNAFAGDSLMYHLPFAIRLWGLHEWPDYSGYFEGRYQGFPVLWRIVLLPALIFREPRLMFIPNLLALGCLCWYSRRYLFIPWSISLLAALCYPVVLFGFASSMQDFFVGATALAGALALFAASLKPNRDESGKTWLAGLLMLVLCANVKYQGLIVSVVILALSILFFLEKHHFVLTKPLHYCRHLLSVAKTQFFIGTLLLSLIFAQPVINFYRFYNPLYPNAFLFFKGPEATAASRIPYISKIPIIYNGLSFFSSALEIDPILRSSRGFLFQRTVHMQNPPESMRQPADPFGNRWIITGGSYGMMFALFLTAAVVTIMRNRNQKLKPVDSNYLPTMQARLMISFLVMIFLPQTLELRYYMYNLLVPAFVAVSSPWPDIRLISRRLCALVLFLTMLSTVALPFYFWTRTNTWLHSRVSWDLTVDFPSKQQCDKLNASLSANQHLDVGIAKNSVLCQFKK